MTVHSVFLFPVDGRFDVESVVAYLAQKPDVLLDPLGTGIFLVCGSPEAKARFLKRRLADPSRFPYAVLVSVKPEVVNVVQEYGDEDRLRSAREFVSWLIAHHRCRIEDEYREDWTDKVAQQGVRALYPEQLV